MKNRDILLIVALTVISIVSLFFVYDNDETGFAYIYVKGSLYGKYDLSSDRSIHIVSDNGIVNDIEISDGSIYMKDATCPGRQCVKCGRISHTNESICCAPSQVLVIIKDAKDADYDAITE